MEKYHSEPNVCGPVSRSDSGRLHSLSLSQIKKQSETFDYHHKPSPFNIRWIHGYNAKVGVVNLGISTAFYAVSNCGVLYNWGTNQMRILQGHRHVVAHIAADAKGKWLVTADAGPENVVIIWNSSDYFPQKTIFQPHGETKLAKVALSADAKYLMTLGYQGKACIYWWIWSYGLDEPHAKLSIELPRDSVIDMEFNPHNSEQFILMTKHDIWIGVSKKIIAFERGLWKETDDYELKIRYPPRKEGVEVGRLTCFTVVERTAQVLAATSRGSLLVYGYTIEYRKQDHNESYENLKFIKVLKIQKDKINVIKNVDGVIVTGNNVGQIHFYDGQMKLLYWIHGFTVDSVHGLSFNISPRSYKIFDPKCKKLCPCWEKVVTDTDPETGIARQKLLLKQIPSDAAVEGKPVVVRDFILCTRNQGVVFVDFIMEKRTMILDNTPANALALTVHPEKPFVCIGYANGIVELVNFVQHRLFARLDLRHHYTLVVPPSDDSSRADVEINIPVLSVTCLKYSPSGLHLACGLNTGQMIFLDSTTVDILSKTPFEDTSYAIKQICYSCDSTTLAFADEGRTTFVYKYNCKRLDWQFVGKHRAHYKDPTCLLFLPQKNEDGEYKLLSLGADRIMVEYDIGSCSNEQLAVSSLDRVEQAAVPLAAIVWPTPKGLDTVTHKADLPTILLANDEYKYKVMNNKTAMTLATVLGPRYEHPVCRLQLICREEGGEEVRYLLFATKNVVGLQKMPLDGNPWKHVGLLAHPLQVTAMCFREDCGVLFTIGLKDSCMTQWAANYGSVEVTTKQGGGDLDPYYCLIENGRPGWLFQEIRDLFYYIQILCQGTFSPAMRRVKDYIPIDSLPDLMRALGFFPTEYEVENLLVEAKYKVYQREASSEIDFEEFVKLYLNHRPAFGDNLTRIRSAFRKFATLSKESYVISRNDFIDMLSNYGECFSEPLAWYLLSILCGHTFEDRAAMTEGDFSFLPEEISFSDLVVNIIGIQDYDNTSEQCSMKESCGSQQTASSVDSDEKLNTNS